ncbi:MAG: DUF1932 domain-containing protein, partial [Alphaproteobacteria bacterium]
AKNLQDSGIKDIAAWDLAFADPSSKQTAVAKALNIESPRSCGEALKGQSVVISAVTAESAEAAARSAAPFIESGALYADVNSVSPGAKQRIGRTVEAKGARFVEVTIMSPINPRGIKSPMLIGGPHASKFIEMFKLLGVDMTAVEGPIGKAAATKMCRSVMYKGMEALFLESMLSARHYGVEKEVLASLKDTLDKGWPETARYMISRTLIHGRRRAEEMREAAKTVEDAGLKPLMTERTAMRQDWAADQAAHLVGVSPNTASLDELLDRLLSELSPAASK